MAGAGDAQKANMIARAMIFSHGFGRRMGPVGLMGHRQGYLSGDSSDWIASLGSDVAQVGYEEVDEVSMLQLKDDWNCFCVAERGLVDGIGR